MTLVWNLIYKKNKRKQTQTFLAEDIVVANHMADFYKNASATSTYQFISLDWELV